MNRLAFLFASALVVLPTVAVSHAQQDSGKIQFNRDIRPILSSNCFLCHGVEARNRKAGLRLDAEESAKGQAKSGARAVVAGDPDGSELIRRVNSEGGDRMPPPDSGKQLTDGEKQLLRRWIAEGAEYQRHWAFVVPQRPALPDAKQIDWPRNPIDRFILGKLEEEGLQPAPEADRFALARRVSLDLIGLPPTILEADQFVNDPSPDAYENFVDRLLASPRYGERWAHVWLDLARYADSKGYADDGARTIWKYRDWVIQAINENRTFERFTIEQLAGDLLPNPSQDQILATAFHRNTLTNDEGGTDDEEFRVAAVVDRVNTTMQVWMGMTMGCAQCHDHKFDSISQEEYYRFFAIFNQSEDSDKPDDNPLLTLISPEDQRKKTALEAEIANLQRQLSQSTPELDAAQQKWEKEGNHEKEPATIKAALAVERDKRTEAQNAELLKYHRSIAAETKPLRDKITALQAQVKVVSGVTTPIMRDLPEGKKRKTNVHVRGDFLNKGKEVTAGLPAAFHPAPEGEPLNRLALAHWLLDPKNPLTARVTVNRYWEQIFGTALMESPEDWGIRSKMPVHPELLDWLAVEFREKDWDVKRLLKLMVMSSTYRQSSRVSSELLEKDPGNRLYARGPRFRSPAEVIRDQALCSAGLLSSKMFGASVRPPRPKLMLNAAFGGATDWDTSPGEDKFRRALYTQWRRTTPYPSMVTFDAPSRNVCVISRPRTNTPLQALVALNDPAYVEAAQGVARRMAQEAGSAEERVNHGFRLCLTRPPHEHEARRLVELYRIAREEFARDPARAKLMAEQPIGPLPSGMDAVDLAAWTVVANVILNLDEVFAKR
jgi:hypothetical protein